MIEWLFYFATVAGVLVLRRRAGNFAVLGAAPTSHASQINPVLFCFASAAIVVRGAIAHAGQVVIIVLYLACGTTVYQLSWWQRLVGRVDGDSAG